MVLHSAQSLPITFTPLEGGESKKKHKYIFATCLSLLTVGGLIFYGLYTPHFRSEEYSEPYIVDDTDERVRKKMNRSR